MSSLSSFHSNLPSCSVNVKPPFLWVKPSCAASIATWCRDVDSGHASHQRKHLIDVRTHLIDILTQRHHGSLEDPDPARDTRHDQWMAIDVFRDARHLYRGVRQLLGLGLNVAGCIGGRRATIVFRNVITA